MRRFTVAIVAAIAVSLAGASTAQAGKIVYDLKSWPPTTVALCKVHNGTTNGVVAEFVRHGTDSFAQIPRLAIDGVWNQNRAWTFEGRDGYGFWTYSSVVIAARAYGANYGAGMVNEWWDGHTWTFNGRIINGYIAALPTC